MSLATRCSACGTVFRVVADQLKVSQGWVRCGRCAEVFNAIECLVDLEPDGSITTPSAQRQRLRDALAQAGLRAATAADAQDVRPPAPPPTGAPPPAPAVPPPATAVPPPPPAVPPPATSVSPTAPAEVPWQGAGEPVAQAVRTSPPDSKGAPAVAAPEDVAALPADAGAAGAEPSAPDTAPGDAGTAAPPTPPRPPVPAPADRRAGPTAVDSAETSIEPLAGPAGEAPPEPAPGPMPAAAAETASQGRLQVGTAAAAADMAAESVSAAAPRAGPAITAPDAAEAWLPATGSAAGDAAVDGGSTGRTSTSVTTAETPAGATAESVATGSAAPPDAMAAPMASIDDITAGPAIEKPGFVRRAERAERWRRPAVRAALSLLVVLAATALALQAALEFRDRIAAQWPAARPVLESVCRSTIRCRVEPLRRIEGLVVESSRLTRIEGTSLVRLSVTLRNRDRFELLLPALDLVLNDAQGRVVARRVLRPAELGAAQETLAPGAELALGATLGHGERGVVGYTIEIFYP